MYTPYAPLLLLLSAIRLVPHLLFLLVRGVTPDTRADIARWMGIVGGGRKMGFVRQFLFLMTFFPEFRNLFYYRIGHASLILHVFCPRMATLFLATPSIGPGLFIQHGFATIVAAKSIGANCWINQQVTIGYSNETDCPTIGDNVQICAGAKVIGKAVVGHHATVGANAVVVRDVPPHATVAGVPARVIRINGERVDLPL